MTARSVPAGAKIVCDLDLEFDPASVEVQAQNSPWPSGYGPAARRYLVQLLPDSDSAAWEPLPVQPVFPDGY